jgi:hypothetical protein
MNQIRIFLTAATCMMAMAASAQWQWIDKDGRKVFSDRAPPSEVQEKNILKRPVARAAVASTAAAAADVSASVPQPGASAPKLNGVDKDLQDKKKKAEEAELAKRKAEEEKVLKAKVENCARAKQAKASLDSGMRIARTNEKGEREVMDDDARASEMKRIQSVIEADCK